MYNILHLRTNGHIDLVRSEEPTLRKLQQLVGGYIEIVHPTGLVPPYVMVVDDVGRLKNKPLNPIASALYGGAIAGDAVVMAIGPNEYGEQDLIGLTPEQVRLAHQYLSDMARRIYSRIEKSPDTAATVPEHGTTTGA